MSFNAVRPYGRQLIEATATSSDLAVALSVADVWEARVITLFPEAFPGTLGLSLTGKALREGLWRLRPIDLRSFGVGRHLKVDDTPAGGGAGMVLRPDVVDAALRVAARNTPADHALWPTICLSPRGLPLDQETVQRLAAGRGLTLLCGRFEGFDQRVLDAHKVDEISLGDFVLTGGEIAAQALIDATVRLIPRVVGNLASTEEESFSGKLLEHSHYTRPANWSGRDIPAILRSGNHGKIADWRRKEAEKLTKERRPDLWRAYVANRERDPDEDQEL